MAKATPLTLPDPNNPAETVPCVLTERGEYGTVLRLGDSGGRIVAYLGHAFAKTLAEHNAQQVVVIDTTDGISAQEASSAGAVLAEYTPPPVVEKKSPVTVKKSIASKKGSRKH